MARRIRSLDMLRGLVVVLMALDHFIYFINRFHPSEFWITAPPVFPATAYAVFRLLSHLCAPGFLLLAGISLVLFADKRRADGRTPGEIRLSLIVRGLILLIVVQFMLEQAAWALGDLGGRGIALNVNIYPGAVTSRPIGYLGVIYVLAMCMVVGSFMYRLPQAVLAVIAVLSVVASPIVLASVDSATTPINPILNALFVPGVSAFFTNYPLFPWFGVFVAGVLVGRSIAARGEEVLGRIWRPGLVALILGLAVRLWYPWGEFHRFQSERPGSFLELSKYPPSLAYLGITLGVLGLLLWVFHRFETARFISWAGRFLEIFGREPLFFYILHLLVYGLLCLIVVLPPSPALTLAGWALSLAVFTPILVWFHKQKTAGRLPRYLGWL